MTFSVVKRIRLMKPENLITHALELLNKGSLDQLEEVLAFVYME